MSVTALASHFSFTAPTPTASPFHEAIKTLSNQRRENRQTRVSLPKIVVLGAGPAGLLRAILALIHGNPVKVFEKRGEDHAGRLNGIVLTKTAVSVLKEYGIYQYLEERGLLGTTPNAELFPVSVSIRDLEAAMRAVIQALSPDEALIQYHTELDSIVKNDARPIDLVLRVGRSALHTLHNVDLLVVAEGSKSKTIDLLLKCRRIEVHPPITVIGGIFASLQKSLKSFFYSFVSANPQKFHAIESASGVVIYTPGLCSIGSVPLHGYATTVQALHSNKGGAIDDFFEGLNAQIFGAREALGQRAPSLQDKYLLTTATMQSDFTLPFCGKLGSHSLFFLAGDALSQVDVTSGRGANTAIKTARDLQPALKREKDREVLLEEYATKTAATIKKNMQDIAHQRQCRDFPLNRPQADFALFQLEQRALTIKTQNLLGPSLSRTLFGSPFGEKCFRAFVKLREKAINWIASCKSQRMPKK